MLWRVLFSGIGFSQAFEVASVKPTPADRLYGMKRECVGTRFSATGRPISLLVQWSSHLNGNRIQGMPEWTKGWWGFIVFI